MNLIAFQVPNKIYINDACEHGLGGYFLKDVEAIFMSYNIMPSL